jgi:hypothetical protein
LKRLSENLDDFTNLSCQFAIAISVAAIVRISQGATFFEKVFLQALLMMQVLAVLTVCVASVPGPEKNLITLLYGRMKDRNSNTGKNRGLQRPSNVSRRGSGSFSHVDSPHADSHSHHHHFGRRSKFTKRMLRVLFYPLVTLALFWIFLSRFDITPARLSAIKTVMSYCAETRAYGDPRWAGYTESVAWPSWIQTLIHIADVDYILIAVIFIVTWAVCVLAVWIFTPAGVALVLSGPMIFFMFQMIKQRNYLAVVTGQEYQDAAWGFGQVLALLMWVPFVAWLLTLCKFPRVHVWRSRLTSL